MTKWPAEHHLMTPRRHLDSISIHLKPNLKPQHKPTSSCLILIHIIQEWKSRMEIAHVRSVTRGVWPTAGHIIDKQKCTVSVISSTTSTHRPYRWRIRDDKIRNVHISYRISAGHHESKCLIDTQKKHIQQTCPWRERKGKRISTFEQLHSSLLTHIINRRHEE